MSLLRSMPRCFSLLCCAAMTACATSSTRSPQTIDLDTEFTLSPSGKARVENSNVEVQFVGISEDSRCPEGTACIWVGEAKVRLEVAAGRGETVLRDVLEQESVLADQYRITVVRVTPLPEANTQIPPTEYRVTLQATRQ